MKEINISQVTENVAKLCISSNIFVAEDIKKALERALEREDDKAKNIIESMLENAKQAEQYRIPLCQDTGMVAVFVELGQDVRIVGGSLENAINEGIRIGYEDGYLRKSVVKDPLRRENTKDNTPAVIHYTVVEGDTFKVTISPKGFGSENMSTLKMLMPSDGLEGIKKFVIKSIVEADSNPCPPIIVGLGIGGTMEKAAIMSKQALLREIGTKNEDEYWGKIEDELLEEINKTGIGPAGFGGRTTALAVHINTYPTHIAGLPVALNIGCHVTRHMAFEL
ncbi:MAG: fumarate hydratase [Defluviitaleaceae bacterium]|nr:fumarate hydratase [Defluviitaleaceae bacterium]